MKESFENPLEASLFFLQKLSTAPPMNKTSGDKGEPLLTVGLEAVEPLFAHVSGVLLP